LFNYNVSLHELPSENKVFIIIIILLLLRSGISPRTLQWNSLQIFYMRLLCSTIVYMYINNLTFHIISYKLFIKQIEDYAYNITFSWTCLIKKLSTFLRFVRFCLSHVKSKTNKETNLY